MSHAGILKHIVGLERIAMMLKLVSVISLSFDYNNTSFIIRWKIPFICMCNMRDSIDVFMI